MGHRPEVPLVARPAARRRSLQAIVQRSRGHLWAMVHDRQWADSGGRPQSDLPGDRDSCVRWGRVCAVAVVRGLAAPVENCLVAAFPVGGLSGLFTFPLEPHGWSQVPWRAGRFSRKYWARRARMAVERAVVAWLAQSPRDGFVERSENVAVPLALLEVAQHLEHAVRLSGRRCGSAWARRPAAVSEASAGHGSEPHWTSPAKRSGSASPSPAAPAEGNADRRDGAVPPRPPRSGWAMMVGRVGRSKRIRGSSSWPSRRRRRCAASCPTRSSTPRSLRCASGSTSPSRRRAAAPGDGALRRCQRLHVDVVRGSTPRWSPMAMNELWARLDAVVIGARWSGRQAHRRRRHGGVGRDVDAGGRPGAGGARRPGHAGGAARRGTADGPGDAGRDQHRAGAPRGRRGRRRVHRHGRHRERRQPGRGPGAAGWRGSSRTTRTGTSAASSTSSRSSRSTVKGKADPLRLYLVREVKERRSGWPTRGVEGVETRMIGRAGELAVLRDGVRAASVAGAGAAAGDGHRRGRRRQVTAAVRVRELDRAASRDAPTSSRAAAWRPAARRPSGCSATCSPTASVCSTATPTVSRRREAAPRPRPDPRPRTRRISSVTGSASTCARAPPCARCSVRASWRPRRAPTSSATSNALAIDGAGGHLPRGSALGRRGVPGARRRARRPRHGRPPARGRRRPADAARAPGSRAAARRARPLALMLRAARRRPPRASSSARSCSRRRRVPDELTDLILERADGNAFYVEELVKMLIEDGVIETGEPWDSGRPRRAAATRSGCRPP